VDRLEARPQFRAARFLDLEEPVVHPDIAKHLPLAGIGRVADGERRRGAEAGNHGDEPALFQAMLAQVTATTTSRPAAGRRASDASA
jgi:hypothetical protein